MRIVRNNFVKSSTDAPQYPRVVTCDNCKSDIEINYSDTHIGILGCRCFKCPCCGDESVLYDEEGIKLTLDNLKFPDHYYCFADGVKLTNKVIDTYVKECITALRESPDKNFYATRSGTGDTHVFVFRYDGDEEYIVYVGKGGYETNVQFEDADYK